MIDEEISRIVRDSQRLADEILRKDIEILHRMAKELLKYETIDSKDLDKILKGEKLTRPLNGSSVAKNQKRPRRRYQRKRNTKNGSNNNSSNGKKSLNNKDVNPKTPTTRKKLELNPELDQALILNSFYNWCQDPNRDTLVMGILNVTPDSFSDGGLFYNTDEAVRHALQLIEYGIDIIDIGGESTRPGAKKISEEEEIQRIIPVVKEIRELSPEIIISIDTTKSIVAQKAIQCGANIINDISGFSFDNKMIDVIRESKSLLLLCICKETRQICRIIQSTMTL